MNSLFTIMTPIEVVMTGMGILLFLVLTSLLIWQVVKQQPFATLLVAFILPIILVGYPAIQSIAIGNTQITITKYAQAVTSDPKDTTARRQLEQELAKFKSDPRVQTSPEALNTVATAQLALGKLDSAAVTVKKATQLDPQSTAVQATAANVNRHILVRNTFIKDVNLLKQQVATLQANPQDTETATKVIDNLATLKAPTYVDASSALVIARSYAILNQKQKSLDVINTVIQADTTHTDAKLLKEKVKKMDISENAVKLTPTQTFQLNRTLAVPQTIGAQTVIRRNLLPK